MACSFSPEALTSLASFTESLSLCLGFLARAKRLSALTSNGADSSVLTRRASQGRGRRRSSVGGRRRTTIGAGGVEGGVGNGWTIAFDLRKVDALLTMLKQLDDQESAGFLMNAGNEVSVCRVSRETFAAHHQTEKKRIYHMISVRACLALDIRFQGLASIAA